MSFFDDPRERQKVIRDLKALNKLYARLGKQQIGFEFAGATKADAEKLVDLLDQAKAESQDLNDGFLGISESIKNITREWSTGFADPTKEATKSMQKLRGISQQMADDFDKINRLELKQLKDTLTNAKKEKKKLEEIRRELEQKVKLGEKITENEKALLDNLKSEYDVVEELVKKTEERLNKEKKIQKNLGITGQLFKGLTNTLSKFGVTAEHFEEMNESMREAAENGGKLSVLGAGIKGLFKGLGKALKDPVVQLTLIVKAVKFLVDTMKMVNNEVWSLSKGFGIAGNEADELYSKFNAIGDSANSIYYFTDELIANQTRLNKEVGMNLDLNEQNAKTFQDLTLYMGYSEESAAKLFRTSVALNVPYNQAYDRIAGIVSETDKQTGVYVQMNTIVDDIANASAGVRSSFKGNFDNMVKAAHAARRMGMSLEDVANSGRDLLNFTETAQKEIRAEQFLGMDLNVFKLQQAVLSRDLNTQAEERERLIKQTMGRALGNKKALEATADLLGMSSEEYLKAAEQIKTTGHLKEEQLDVAKSSQEEMSKVGKEAQALDRSFDKATRGLKKSLLPVVEALTPLIIGAAEAIGGLGTFLQTDIGQMLLKLAGWVGAGFLVFKGFNALKDLFLGKRGSNMANPEYVFNMNESGGMPGNNKMRFNLKTAMFKGNVTKYLTKNSGLRRTIQRLTIKTFGKNKIAKKLYNAIGNAKVQGKVSRKFADLTRKTINKFSSQTGEKLVAKFGTNNMSKIMKMAETGRYAKGTIIGGKKVGGQIISKTLQQQAAKTTTKNLSKQAKQQGVKVVQRRVGQKVTQEAEEQILKQTGKQVMKKTGKTIGKKIMGKIPLIGIGAELYFAGTDAASGQQDQYDPVTGEKIYDDLVRDDMGKGEAFTYSLLTGGKNRGTVVSDLTNYIAGEELIEKGGAADEALGVGTATASGAATGAAIGAGIGVWFFGVGAPIGAAIGGVIGGAAGFISETWKLLSDEDSNLRQWLSRTWDSVSSWFSETWDSVSTWFGETWDDVSNWFSDKWDQFSNWWDDFTTSAWDSVTSLLDDISDWASDTASDVSDGLEDAWDATVDFFTFGSNGGLTAMANGGITAMANGGVSGAPDGRGVMGSIISKPLVLPSPGGTANSAVIPLPDGRSVPVTMYGGSEEIDRQIVQTVNQIKQSFMEGKNVYINNLEVGKSSSKIGNR